MELDSVQRSLAMLHTHHDAALRFVAPGRHDQGVGHADGGLRVVPNRLEVLRDVAENAGATVRHHGNLAVRRVNDLDVTAEPVDHPLHPEADPEHWDFGVVEDGAPEGEVVLVVHGARPG